MTRRQLRLGLASALLLIPAMPALGQETRMLFEVGETVPMANAENEATMQAWQKLLTQHVAQTHWRFVLAGYLPAGCDDLSCGEATLLRRRAEHIMSQLSSRATISALQWRGLNDHPAHRLTLYLDSRQQVRRTSHCAGYLSVEDASLPPAWPERQPKPHSLRWQTTASIAAGSRIRLHERPATAWEVTTLSGYRVQASDGIVVLSRSDLPARAGLLDVEARRGLGDSVKPWTSQVASRPNESACEVQFRRMVE